MLLAFKLAAKLKFHQEKLASQEVQVQQEVARQIPNAAIASTSSDANVSVDVKWKHIAQRKASERFNYGFPENLDTQFEAAAVENIESIREESFLASGSTIIRHFELTRFQIAAKRGNVEAQLFGLRGDSFRQHQNAKTVYVTQMRYKNEAYGYALKRAVKIPYDDMLCKQTQ